MGSRVTRNQSKDGRSFLFDRLAFLLLKIITSIRYFLILIGTPIYYLLTFLVVVLSKFSSLVFSQVIKFFKQSLKRKSSKSRKTKNLKLPTFRLPIIPKQVYIFLIAALFMASLSLFAWFTLFKDLPKPGILKTREQVVSSKIYDRNGNLLYKIYKNENRTLVDLKQIPKYVKEATIAIEDADFYSHPGFSLRGITRAFYKNATSGEKTGGSTITQQLIKNTLLTSEKTLKRKIKEIILSIQTEFAFSKDEILGMYFNEVAYGGSAYGIEEAAQLFFGKHVDELNLSEAALLAGLPKAPTTYSPFGANPKLAKSRQLEVLQKMVEEGYITKIQADESGQENLIFAQQRNDIKAPHFVMWIKQQLAEKYGERVVEEGGLEVYTTLDLGIQEMAEKIVQEETEKIKKMKIGNGAVLVTEPQTGAVLAMVGSKDYFDSKNQGNFNVTNAPRQPGSAIKPINYSYAIEHKLFTASSLISDTPITYQIAGSEPYSPRNYDHTFRGNVALRTALGSSLNVPAVKILASYGVKNMVDHAQKMGIMTWTDPKRYGLSLTLGGGEVKMTEMNVAFGVFANYGKRVDLQPITKIINYKGQRLEINNCQLESPVLTKVFEKAEAAEAVVENDCTEQVLDEKTAFIITNILSDNQARSPVFGTRSLLVIPNHPEIAVKTGTTQNLRDNWAIGYNQNYVVSAWVGNNDNTPMAFVASGVTGATPIWHKIITNLTENRDVIPWKEPQGIIKTIICPKTGTLPCQGCGGKVEYFLPETEPTKQCIPPKPDEEEENPEVSRSSRGLIL